MISAKDYKAWSLSASFSELVTICLKTVIRLLHVDWSIVIEWKSTCFK